MSAVLLHFRYLTSDEIKKFLFRFGLNFEKPEPRSSLLGSQRQKCKVLRKLIRLSFFVELSSLIILVKTKYKFYQ
jgi:hypothetical protein